MKATFTLATICCVAAVVTAATTTELPLPLSYRVLFCWLLTLFGATMRASQKSRRILIVLRSGMMVSLLGICLAFGAEPWVVENPLWSYWVIAASIPLGLAGDKSLTFVESRFFNAVDRKLGDKNEK